MAEHRSESDMIREIPTLKTIVLKQIAKKPSVNISLKGFQHLLKWKHYNFDITQVVIDAITEAGRLTDEIFPIEVFSSERTTISLTNSKLSSKYFHRFFAQCPNLQIIDLSGSFQVDDSNIEFILGHCTNLRSLYIRNCRKITAKSLDSILNHNVDLKDLDIGGDVNIDLSKLNNFLTNYEFLHSIENLQLSGLVFNDYSAVLLLQKCKNLRSFGLGYADISDQTVTRLLQAVGSKLEYLNISWLSSTPLVKYSQIDANKVLNVIAENCPLIQELDINGLKTATVNDILNFLDLINQKSINENGMNHPLKLLHAKFVSSNKSQIENQIVNLFPHIRFDL